MACIRTGITQGRPGERRGDGHLCVVFPCALGGTDIDVMQYRSILRRTAFLPALYLLSLFSLYGAGPSASLTKLPSCSFDSLYRYLGFYCYLELKRKKVLIRGLNLDMY